MGGTYVLMLGMDVDTTPTSDLADMGRIVTFFEQTDFSAMAPNNGRANSDTDYVLSVHPTSYIAYADSGSGNLGLTTMSAGVYDFFWFDPVDGDTVTQQDQAVTDGTNTWARPSGIGAEAVVWISTAGGTGAVKLRGVTY
jgi:hypothetical protein